jgi:alpha-beta hydrolase superfamily lysophospholipase
LLVGGLLLVVALVITWAITRAPTLRPADAVMRADTSCSDVTATGADLALVGGSGVVACESWDIGTGVTGYAWHATSPRGVVLFQHGWGDYTQRWAKQADQFIPALVAEGYTVYGFDMWGSGRSPGARGVTDIRAAVIDHEAARDAIEASGDGDLPLFLAAHSIGGLVTATSVLDDPADVAGVVLLAPGLLYDVPDSLLQVAEAGAFLAPAAPVPGMSNDEGSAALTSDPASIEAMNSDEILYNGSMNFLTASTGGNLAGENWSRYDEWDVPVLVVHGTADTSTDPRGSADFIDAVATSDAILDSIEGGKHALLDDTMADTVRDTVVSWITERTR